VVVAAVVVALIVRAVRKRRRPTGEPVADDAPTVAVAVGEAPVRR
jgi:membrane-associated protein